VGVISLFMMHRFKVRDRHNTWCLPSGYPLLSSRLFHRSATNGSCRVHVAEAIVFHEG
jgi:hypothetical protein